MERIAYLACFLRCYAMLPGVLLCYAAVLCTS